MATTEWLRVYNDQAAVECCGYALDGEVLALPSTPLLELLQEQQEEAS